MNLNHDVHARLNALGFVPSSTQCLEYEYKGQVCVITAICSGHLEVFLCGQTFGHSARATVDALTLGFRKDAILFAANFELAPKMLPKKTHRLSTHVTLGRFYALFYPRTVYVVVGEETPPHRLPFACSVPPYLLGHKGALTLQSCDNHTTLQFKEPIVIWHPSYVSPDLPMFLEAASGLALRNVRINKKKFFASMYRIPASSSVYWFQEVMVHIVQSIVVNISQDFKTTYTTEYEQLRSFCVATETLLSHKARVIQRAWRRCVSDPSYAVCKKRLLKEFGNMQD
jgi:hypothetical protein